GYVDGADGGHRHHRVVAGAEVDVVDALRRFAEVLLRLQHDLVGPREQIEVVDLEAAEVDLEALEDAVDRDVQGAHLVAVDVQLDLGNGGAEAGVDTR